MRHFNLVSRRAFLLSATMVAPVMVLSRMSTPSLAKGTTLDNLMTAYNGESNANARYMEFAKKAEAEGYLPIASLFRAAAQSEKIHANNHAEVIKKMGGTPKAEIQKVEVKSTKENLEAALKGETYENDVMYAEFLKQARAENNKPAIRTFNFAKSVEAIHAALYTEALAKLATLKGGQKKQYYVCPECGNTVVTLPSAKCPICFTPKEMFDAVS